MKLPPIGTYRLRMQLLRWAAPRSGLLARLARYPNPFDLPWRRTALDIVAHGGIGDVIMCTPTLRELKRRNPRCHLRFYSMFSPLVRGLPYIDEALPYEDRPDRACYLDYADDNDFVAPRAPLVSLLGDRIGLRVTDTTMECRVDSDLVSRYQAAWRHLPHPHVVAVRRSSSHRTLNKNWPDDHWQSLIPRLCRKASVIELGGREDADVAIPEQTYLDLRGRTSIEEMVAAIAAADLYVGPMSGPAHVAAAVGTPGVIIYGGYEPPAYSAYPNRVGLATQVPCAPCWLVTPCPYDHKCLRAISPATVEAKLWEACARQAAA